MGSALGNKPFAVHRRVADPTILVGKPEEIR
jgi:hypothetical protein